MKIYQRVRFNRVMSLLLIATLVFNLFAFIIPSSVFAATEQQIAGKETFTLEDLIAGSATAEDVYGVLERSTVPDIVGYDEALRMNHVRRLYEDEADNLNTVIFLNADGSKTMYVFDHPIKYIGEDGTVKDISLEIAESGMNGSGYQSISSPALTTFSAQFSDGISLSGNGVEIRLAPVLTTTNTGVAARTTLGSLNTYAEVQKIDSKKVSYRYDDVTTVEYSLTYTGF